MRNTPNRVVFCLCLCAVAFPAQARNSQSFSPQLVSANEKSALLTLQEKSSTFSIELSLSSGTRRLATLFAKIVAPNGVSLAEASSPFQLSSSPLRVEVPLKWFPRNELEDVASSRLLYEVRLDGDKTPDVSGILSPYNLIPNLFELRFAGLDAIGLGRTYLARVRATRPDTNEPVPGVLLTGILGDDDETEAPKGLKSSTRTNSRGEATLKFRLPEIAAAPDDKEIDLEIRGSLGFFKNSLTSPIQFWRRAAILLSTDKPLYQPEQTLHLRALLIDDQRRAWAKQGLHFVVRDADDTIVFSQEASTSRFGIASADWSIPSSQKLGFYRVTVESSTDENSRDMQISQSVRISRYELPTFTVNVHTDHPFYLPGQNADLTVSADYLFGKPVLRGHVRVLRESSRSWNYRDQKWDTEEDLAGEGDLGQKNQFQVSLNLEKDHAGLKENDWKRYEDLRFAAYLTDSSSGRTEERHFDVRISREPIHIYVLNASGSLASGLQPEFYISSAFADGTPTPADLNIQLFAQDPTDPAKAAGRPFSSATARSSKYGIARVLFPSPLKKDSDDQQRIYAVVEAKSPDGRTAKHLESYSFDKEQTFRITPAKVILNPRDTIVAKIESSGPKSRARVDVVRSNTQTILATQEINLSHGSAQVTFPTDDQYIGKITLVVYPPDVISPGSYSSYRQVAAAIVLFPEPSTLKLDVIPVKKSFRPGESAAVSMQVRGTQGELAEGALGLLVYDQAVEELARTEASLSTGGYERINPTLGFQNSLEEDNNLGGVHEKDLLNRAPGSPVPADLELAAQALVASQAWAPMRLESSDSERDFSTIFSSQIGSTIRPVLTVLEDFFSETGHYPADDATYANALERRGFHPRNLTDPWGNPYHVRRTYEWLNEVLEFRSSGPDKTPGTADDFTAFSVRRHFFEHDEDRIRKIVESFQTRTRSFIRDETTLKLACDEEHTPLSSFVDPWGTPYHFEFSVDRDYILIEVTSAGPDKRFHTENSRDDYGRDDLVVTRINSPYFSEIAKKIDSALLENAKTSARFPENEQEFSQALQKFGVNWDKLCDPWGHPYRVKGSLEYKYSDKITVHAYGQNVSSTSAAVTSTFKGIIILSDGPDGIPNNADDFTLARFISPFHEQAGGPVLSETKPEKTPQFYSGNSGAIRVEVKDPSGASIQGAKVTLTNQSSGLVYSGTTNDQGICLVGNMPAGMYRLLVESNGFKAYTITGVPVFSSNATNLEVTLSLGSATETVSVEAAALQLQTLATVSGARIDLLGLTTKSGAAKGQINIPLATPRLRENFPETLLWRPEVLTDRAGHATVKFPLADSITTWKVSVIASTLDGRIATASTDLRAFQPFFAELDPPKVLTVGDEIRMPVTVRNYLDKPQSVSLDWSPEPWAQSLSPSNAQLDVPAGDYSQKSFSFRAMLPFKDARQRVTAFNRSSRNEGDAIERKLRVHPDGQERLAQASTIFSGSTTLSVDLPANSLPGSIEAELVIYPNLLAHVSDAIEGIMERPYGCAEQTISSAYPSLLWLQLQKSQKFPASPLDVRARHYLVLAYAKLLGYRDSAGGFSYWGKGEPYIPLTAYALRFLTEASEFIDVDQTIISGTRRWLLEQASPNGTWLQKDSKGQSAEWSLTYYTTYVVQILSRDLLRADRADKKEIESERALVAKGIEYLSKSITASSDPYRIALLALAKASLKQDVSLEIAALLANEHTEEGTIFWNLQQNTLFYGWGLAGRLETTALVLEALAIAKQQGNAEPSLDRALSLGTHFLLKKKDRYHVWYSTQSTVNVLQCLVRQLSADPADSSAQNSPAAILVDDRPGPELPPAKDAWQLAPQRVDLTAYLGAGAHKVEIRGGSFHQASAYLNATYYLPWSDPSVTRNLVPTGDSESIRYSVKFDRTAIPTGDKIECTVHAERVGFRGYGMMLAEVGLPPGADVDRASLENAVNSDWAVQSYEVQPDRVVLYLWPPAGGTTFSFALTPRFPMNAQSAESVLYDYYNPLARASVQPVRFTVQ